MRNATPPECLRPARHGCRCHEERRFAGHQAAREPDRERWTSPLTTRQFWNQVERAGEPGRLLGTTEEDLVGVGLGTDLTNRLAGPLARATVMAFELERLDQSGIATLTPFDHAYPQRFRTNLGPKAPPILHAAGTLYSLTKEASAS